MTPRRASLCALSILVASVSFAGAPAVAPAGSLYERLGNTPKVAAIVDQTMDLLAARQRSGSSPESVNLPQLKGALLARICSLSGGGCKSAGVDLNDAQYRILVEPLRIAMRAHDVPLPARNELLEILAPTVRGVAKL
jgi:hypothetical protein